jgi:two-component system chemotaxis sensor kinase CheA
MDVSQYLPMFLAEAREHLQELNLAVVRVEEAPDDRETVDEIFRIAHSLKGMSATMGFERMAALTHKMEDVFELLRQRRGGLDRAAIDVLLECLDALEAGVSGIEADGAESLDSEPLIERLKSLVREPDEEEEGSETPPADEPLPPTVELGARRLVHVRIALAADVLMPAVRAYQAVASLADHGDVVRSLPAESALDSFAGRDLEIWVATEHPAGALRETALAVGDVLTVTADEVEPETTSAAAAGETFASPKATQHASKSGGTVRIDAERLDQLMHLMGELVVHRTRVESLAGDAQVPGLHQAMQDLTRSSQALQAMVMQVRMIPVESVFLRFPRLVRDLSTKLGKHVELKLLGQDTELDRTVVEALGDPLVHLVRNSLDHGLESPEERVAAGKPEVGTLEISARHAGGNVVIEVRDDGHGIDPTRVARKALERGLITEDAVATIDMTRAIELLFSAGFSTAEVTSDISGRGVGMDAVRSTVRDLGGEVLMTSELGVGTTAQIRLPLTLAIMAALLVEANGVPLAIPLDRVERTLNLQDYALRSVAGRRMLVLRDAALPLVDTGSALGYDGGEECSHAVIVRAGEHRLALAVARLVGQRELVTRALPPEVGERAALSGGAVLSNGEIALIVDCDAIADTARRAPIATLAA